MDASARDAIPDTGVAEAQDDAPELLAKLRALVREGGVLLGPAPQRSPSLEGYPDADARVRRMAAELWGGVDGKAVKAAATARAPCWTA